MFNKSKKRICIVSDFHCGHRVGLTPPKWHDMFPKEKYAVMEKKLWKWYSEKIKTIKPIDLLFVNGDCIEGKAPRSGSTELITADRNIQCEMAKECILETGAKEIIMIYGTPYHTGYSEDWEDQIAKSVGAKQIGSQLWVDVNGLVFDLKHFVSKTSVPYTKGTPLLKEKIWNMIWSEFEEQPKADVIIRSHVHSFDYVGFSDKWLAITTPALQGMGTKYGARQCSGHVDFGFLTFDIVDKFNWTWDSYLCTINDVFKREAIKVK